MSRFEEVKSIVENKLIYKTEKRDYEELSEELFGEGNCFNSSEVRKRMYGMKTLLEILEEEGMNNLSENEILNQIEEKRLELEKERKKLQTTKIERNRNVTKESRQELLYENIRDAVERLPLPEFKEIPMHNTGKGAYVLCWADLHYGADFVSQNNVYNREVCREKMEKLTAMVKEKCINLGINRLIVCGLGDEIQGMLRISDVKVNDIPVVESVVEVSRLIGQVLNSISEVTNVVYYHTMASNHSQTRPLNSKQLLAEEDLEVIIGNYIKDILMNNGRIEVVLTDRDYHSIEIEGQNVLLLHGHQVKSVKNVVKDYSTLHRLFYDIVILGHYHSGQSISVGELDGNTEVKVIPSIVGSDPYADSLKVGSKSMSKMFKIERGLGITEEYTFVLN